MDTNYLEAKGWLTEGERRLLKSLATGLDENDTIINIGVEYGASLHCLRSGSPKARIIGIDIIGDSKLVGDPRAEIFETRSSDFLDNWLDPVSLVFVDGDHTYNGVVMDCDWSKFVIWGGVIAFHDCYDPDTPGLVHTKIPAVNRAVSAWAADHPDFEELYPVDSTRVFTRLS